MTISQDPDRVTLDNSEERVSPTDSDVGVPPANSGEEEEPEGWDSPQSWEQLLFAIRFKQCTPFLGAGACAGVLRLGKTIARDWAKNYHYPFSDSDNLPRVAQFLALMKDGGQLLPRYKLKAEFEGKLPDFTNPDEPHRVVAELGLPIYITTNYDSFMTNALQAVGRDPIQECCQWHKAEINSQTKAKGVGSGIDPTPKKPVVFHLHGYLADEASMVLTDDDYLNFLINTSQFEVIPSHIERAFANNITFLFIGYSLEDMSFKVLFRKFAKQITETPGSRHVAVQLPSTEGLSDDQKDRQRDFLQEVFKSQKVKVYWGDAKKFARSLRKRWEEYKASEGFKNGN